MNFKPYGILILLLLSICNLLTVAAEVKLPDALLSYKYGPEQYVFVVEKSSQSMWVYSTYKDAPLATFKVTTGKQSGPKIAEGDLKTPEGIYFFTNIIKGPALPKSEDYGEKAFVLDYPNPIDRIEKRDGSGIWLHGAFDINKTASPNNSRGCVVVSNKDLGEVSKYVILHQTPIVIYDKVRYDSIENIQKKREYFLSAMKDWKTQWENKDIEGYIKYYHPKFVYNKATLPQFKQTKERLNERYQFIRVILTEINPFFFQNEYAVVFNQMYVSDLSFFNSKKIQYWKEEGGLKIVDEQNFGLPQPSRIEVSKGVFMTLEEFRKDVLKGGKPETNVVSSSGPIVPAQVHVKILSVSDQTLKLTVLRSEAAKNMKIVPVLKIEGKDNKVTLKTLDGIGLKESQPQDYSKAIVLDKNEVQISMKIDNDSQIRSLTIFLVNSRNSLEQIVTYFMNL